MKKNVLKYGVIILVVAIVGIGVVLFTRKEDKKETLAAEIDYNFAQLSALDTSTIISSNPYDYVDNEYYDNIVGIGIPAIEILEEKYVQGELVGLDAYIAGIAIQEISGLDLYDVTGEVWETADQFFYQWNKMIQGLPDVFEEIALSEDTLTEKIEDIELYGVFGEAFLQSIVENMDKNNPGEISYYGKSISLESFAEEEREEDMKAAIHITEDVVKEVDEYIEASIAE